MQEHGGKLMKLYSYVHTVPVAKPEPCLLFPASPALPASLSLSIQNSFPANFPFETSEEYSKLIIFVRIAHL